MPDAAPPFDMLPFELPATDSDAATEAGVVLMGLDTERLLATLGVSALAGDFGALVSLIDHASHQGAVTVPYEVAVSTGARQWRSLATELRAADGGVARSGAPREAFAAMLRVVDDTSAAAASPTLRGCLAACWYRREEIDRWLR